ncbi:Gfo/Idh/MocA family protein [Chloroflexota bacterium]
MIDCALIGCGYWGSKLKRYIEENPGFRLRYICNSSSDLNEVWRDKQVTAVVVATPNEARFPVSRAALLAGKNLLSEKPLAMETVQCEELRDIALKNNLILMVEYTYTFSRALEQARGIIKSGAIGKIRGMEMTVRHLGRFGGGSVYWLLGSHMLSVLDMFSPISMINFERRDLVTSNDVVETGVIFFRNADISGHITVSLNYPDKKTKVIIYGENGTVIYNPVTPPSLQVETYRKIPWTVAAELPRERHEFDIDESHNLRLAVDYFHRSLTGKTEGNLDRAITITRILETLESGRDCNHA